MQIASPQQRLLALVFLLVVLGALFVWAGTLTPNPAVNHYPGNDDVGPSPEAYVGQQVALGGTVVSTEPAVVRIQYGIDETRTVTLQSLDEPVTAGQNVQAFGTLTDADTLTVERALVRSPWEAWYMYVVSFVGGLWVLGRGLTQWRFNRDRLAIVPRGDRDA